MRMAAGVVVAGLLLAGCGGGDRSATSANRRTLRVFAASSLTEAFTELGGIFEEAHPGV